ncbi:activator of 90 kDa heat shock protein ATPase homolog 1 [Coccinella septempunctata]|uniref:activator of 90 kDa heat shock protein ATPase homolog 1 n=1 Tax=Coccinella septempunctata TaxID=41139 RepID=UPI001D06960F|nr:activator of 90 kDa heat shock protein ATPase homolog 1 [Coccinella septempunctata]
MAKWGEGDPRWIVEERPDATNVNNWHWTEKNAGPWSQDKFKELFTNLEIKSEIADFKVEVEKCEGEASANNRKGRLIFFYEWDIVLKWKGSSKSGNKYSGTFKVPNVSEENDVKEFDITVSMKDEDGEEASEIKKVLQKDGVAAVRSQLGKYITELKEEFTKGMILPKKGEVKPDNVVNHKSGFNKTKVNMQPVTSEKKELGVKIEVKTIKDTQKFQCKASEFYDAMTRIEMVTAFTHGPVKLELFKNGKFELFGGNISGEFIELEPARKIVQKWRYKQWPSGHYSTVTLDIDEKSDHTEVSLVQTGVPSAEADITRGNWQRYYWDSMKKTFGFGSFIQ